MRPAQVNTIKYKDNLAEKRRKVYLLKTLFFVGLAIVIVGLLLYLFFFSGLLEIKEISVNGLNKVDKEKFDDNLNERLDSRWLGYVENQKNVVFFDSDAFKAEVLSAFPEIKEVSINKNPPHSLDINVTERITAGIWCFEDNCKYFDAEGNTWGETAKSSGFLILSVEDLRRDSKDIDMGLLGEMILISEHLKEIDIFVNKFIIPENYIGDFDVLTSKDYKLIFSIDSDIEEQLEILDIFLAEKQKEPEFKPQYIDLRINGRIYFK